VSITVQLFNKSLTSDIPHRQHKHQNQFSPLHTFKTHAFKIAFNIILPPTPWSSKCTLPVTFYIHIYLHVPLFLHACPIHPNFDFISIIKLGINCIKHEVPCCALFICLITFTYFSELLGFNYSLFLFSFQKEAKSFATIP